MTFSPIYFFVVVTVTYVFSQWFLLFTQKLSFRAFNTTMFTAFIGTLLYIMYDFAQWVGQSNIFIIGLIDQAVRFLQHNQ